MSPYKKASVLIVEDDNDIREALDELLNAEGFFVQVAENGRRALDLLVEKKTKPDLILLDVSMPVLDGPGFIRALEKEFPTFNEIPILTMTAAGPAEIPEGRLNNTVMRKPLDVEALMDRVESLLEQKGA